MRFSPQNSERSLRHPTGIAQGLRPQSGGMVAASAQIHSAQATAREREERLDRTFLGSTARRASTPISGAAARTARTGGADGGFFYSGAEGTGALSNFSSAEGLMLDSSHGWQWAAFL